MKVSMKGLSVTQLMDEGRLLRRALGAATQLVAAATKLGIGTVRKRRRKTKKRKARKTAVKPERKSKKSGVKTHLAKAKPEKPKRRRDEDE